MEESSQTKSSLPPGSSPGSDGPGSRTSGGTGASGGGVTSGGGDDPVERAKQRLLALGEEHEHSGSSLTEMIRKHALATIGAALAGGMILGRAKMARKVAGRAARWSVKRAIRRMIHRE